MLALLSFASGLPLALVKGSVPTWLRTQSVDLQTIGWFSLASLPWGLKFLWSPVIDRYSPIPPGRRRGWICFFQAALAASVLCLAGLNPTVSPWLVGMTVFLVAFFSASQDIALDAFAVESMKKSEYGSVNGLRVAFYRVAMLVGGGVAIAAAAYAPWSVVFSSLAAMFLIFIPITLLNKEPAETAPRPASLADAIVKPLASFFKTPRVIEIAFFILLFKASDNMANTVIQPFLVDEGYSLIDIGIGMKTVGLVATLAGAFIGGMATSVFGIKKGLFMFGCLQGCAHAGYWGLTLVGKSVPFMFAAVGMENFFGGMGTAALLAFLMSLCNKSYSATQYALLTSFFGLGGALFGPVSTYMAKNLGYSTFFFITIPLALIALPPLMRLDVDSAESAKN